MARRARHEKINDALGFRREVRRFRREWIGLRRDGGFSKQTFREQRIERHRADTNAALFEKPAAGDGFLPLFQKLNLFGNVHSSPSDPS